VAALIEGKVSTFEIKPEELGLDRAAPGALRGDDADHNAAALKAVLSGQKGPFRDVALLNAAAGLVVAEKADTLKAGLSLAQNSIDEGAAEASLHRLIKVSNAA
jgi:anthranilate phosphoribosyltransferase